METELLTLKFSNLIRFEDIPLFRGGIIQMIERETGDINLLFHNHLDGRFRWSYPLVQYKQINGKAAIVCIGDGIDAIKDFFCTSYRVWLLHGEKIRLQIDDVAVDKVSIGMVDKPIEYCIHKWIPLNSGNYERYIQIERLSDRTCFLENLLSANILSMAKGLGIRIESMVECNIKELSKPRLFENKSVKMMAFDAYFKTNITLPQYIGLGKHVSVGYGSILIP